MRKQPSYRLHRARNCAVVTIDGKNHYLGAYGSPESHQRYAHLLCEWQARQHSPGLPQFPGGQVPRSINEVLALYWAFAKTYYVQDGLPTKEQSSMWAVIRTLRQLYGMTAANAFGPKALKAVRQHMVDQEHLSRGVANNRVNRIKRIFKWAVSEELVIPGVYEGLRAVAGLRFGRTAARETEPIKPACEVSVATTIAYVAPQVAAMIRLQQVTGMRPAEVVGMRELDIDRTGPIWIFEPRKHKNRWRNHRRQVPLGPQAQEIIRPFLTGANYLFSPAEVEAWRNQNRKHARRSKITPSQSARKAKSKPKRAKRDHYDTDSYRRAITYGIKKARRAGHSVKHWHPNQLRHSRATEVRQRYGLEGAQVALGHANANVTEVYAERNLKLAMQIAQESG